TWRKLVDPQPPPTRRVEKRHFQELLCAGPALHPHRNPRESFSDTRRTLDYAKCCLDDRLRGRTPRSLLHPRLHSGAGTGVRARAFALLPSDIKYLEDMGILVDSSVVPDADYKMFVDWKGAPHEPYHSSSDDLTKSGNNRILHIPIATHEGVYAYLHHGFHALK